MFERFARSWSLIKASASVLRQDKELLLFAMFERFARSWSLIKASASVLRQDKELLLFPLLSSIATLLVAAAFILPALGLGALDGLQRMDEQGLPPLAYALAFLFYLSQYFVIFFFNTALVGAAMIRLQGGDPTVGDGLRIAGGKIGAIFGYALVAATVGMILRAIQERAGWLGRWIAGLLGAAWTVASFLVVPVLVSRDVGPIEAVKESALLLKRTWGENVIGQGGIGLVFGLINFLVVIAGAALIVAAAMSQFGGPVPLRQRRRRERGLRRRSAHPGVCAQALRACGNPPPAAVASGHQWRAETPLLRRLRVFPRSEPCAGASSVAGPDRPRSSRQQRSVDRSAVGSGLSARGSAAASQPGRGAPQRPMPALGDGSIRR